MTGRETAKNRREKLLASLGKSVAILKGAPEQVRSHDTEHPYRQDSDFYYLTQYDEPGAACILNPNDSKYPFTLFVLPKDPEKEVWTGWRLSFDETKERYGADRVLDISQFESMSLEVMKSAEKVYTNLNHDREAHYRMLDKLKQVRGEVQRNGGGPEGLESVGHFTHEMRLYKDDHEIELMQRAADISVEAHKKAMKHVRPGMYEYELQAVLEGHILAQGADGVAYISIVGAGQNATVLHYIKNRSQINEGDLILIDAAAEYGLYAADITRTFPANGVFSDVQRQIYQIVLNAQKAVIRAAKPGVTFQSLHDLDLKLLVEGMLDIGLLSGSSEDIIREESYKPYFMHKTGHWLGMDVHDVGKYKVNGEDRVLEPGMVFTVEPGIYVASHSNAPEQFRGIGVRIEDNILITENGNVNLTEAMPKEIPDIEALISSGR